MGINDRGDRTGGRWGRRTGRAGWTLALWSLLFTAGNAVAQYQELDAIVAVVEEDVILASELLSRLELVRKQIAQSGTTPPPNDILVSQLMERLIVESLQLQQAQRRGVEIDDETLTRAVAGFAQNNQMTLDQFRLALAQDGLDYVEFREDIRREMIISRLQRGIVNRRIAISEQEIDDFINSPYFQEQFSDEYSVGHILLAVADDASEETRERARNAAEEIVLALRGGADFRETAIAKSAGSRALEGGDLGWRRAAELPSLFAQQVLNLKIGETSDPIRSGSGFHIVQLFDRRGAGTQKVEQAQLRHILVQPSEIRSPEQTADLIRDIYARIQAGEDFEALAKEFSEDPGSALNGGDLGWSSGEEFVPQFREAMAATATGSLSPPFQTQYGWHVLEVLQRREADMSDEARKRLVVEYIHNRRFEEERQEWLKEIRDEAYVDVRL